MKLLQLAFREYLDFISTQIIHAGGLLLDQKTLEFKFFSIENIHAGYKHDPKCSRLLLVQIAELKHLVKL